MTVRTRRNPQSNDTRLMTKAEVQSARFDADAEHILGTVLHRRNWIAKDRDAIAKAISGIVAREMLFHRPDRARDKKGDE